MKFVKGESGTLRSAEGIIQLCSTAWRARRWPPMRDFPVISLFCPVISGRFPAFALIPLLIW
jgi:hypothetical protein